MLNLVPTRLDRQLKLAAIAGLLAGSIVAVTMTIVDWRLNPGGLFHGEEGTNWGITAETAISWLWPVAVITFLAAACVLYAVSWIRGR